MTLSFQEEDRLALTMGVRLQYGRATAYPDLVARLDRLYADRVAKLPWVPDTWLDAVRALQRKYPGDLVQLTPALRPASAGGGRGHMAPSFADTLPKLEAWDTIYAASNDGIVAYANKQAELGAQKLASLQAAAAFWDGAYRLAKTVRDLPAATVSAVTGGMADFLGTFLPDSLKSYAKVIFWLLVLLIVGGLVAWYRKRLVGLVGKFKRGAA